MRKRCEILNLKCLNVNYLYGSRALKDYTCPETHKNLWIVLERLHVNQNVFLLYFSLYSFGSQTEVGTCYMSAL